MYNKHIKILFLSFLFLLGSTSTIFAQKESFKKADKLYKQREYAAAIPMYEAALKAKDKASARFKLAYCYRMLNQMQKAEELYASLIGEKRIKAITYFYYGEALMSNGKYDEAKVWFKEFDRLKPEDGSGARMAKACDEVRYIQPYFNDIKITSFNQNSPVDDTAPVFFNNGIIFSSDRKAGIGFLKQKSRWTGREYIKLYFSEQLPDGSFAKPKSYSRKLNALNKNTSCISVTADSTTAFFTRNSMLASRGNVYNMQLYQASSTDGQRWKNVELLPFSNNELNYMHPAVSPDGQSLYFVSDSKKGNGGTDIYVSKRTKKGWSNPQNLGPTINTAANEGFPFLHEDGRLFFCSKGHTGYGGFDIFFSEQDEAGNWSAPVNLGQPINSSFDDITIFLKKGGQTGLFTSSRAGGDDDIFLFEILPAGAGIVLETDRLPAEVENLTDLATTVDTTRIASAESLLPDTSSPELDRTEVIVKEENQRIIPIEKAEMVLDSMETDSQEIEIVNEINATEQLETEESTSSEETPQALASAILADTLFEVASAREEESFIEAVTASETVVAEEKMPVIATTPQPKEAQQLITINMDTTVQETEAKRIEAVAIPTKEAEVDSEKNIYEAWFQLIAEQPIAEANTVQIQGVQFPAGAHKIAPSFTKNLDTLVVFLKRHPSLEVEICGHTWSLGNDQKNWELSKKRARSIVAYLMRHGIHNKRLSFKAFGETLLVNGCSNGVKCSEADHLRNERLEMKVIRF